jgi:glycosyltransferase involved in cell wall biosynthesis
MGCREPDLVAPYAMALNISGANKNAGRLLRVWRRLWCAGIRWPLAIAGHPPACAQGEEFADLRESGAIKLLGYLEASQLATLLVRAEAFVFPSLYEGFGLPVVEAMLAGVPVACSNAAALPEVCAGAAMLFDPLCERDIAEKLSLVLTNPAVRKGLVGKGSLRAAEFSWNQTAEQTLALYRKVSLCPCRGHVLKE